MFKKFTKRLLAPAEDGTKSTAYLYKRLYEYFRPYWFRTLIAVLITIPIGALDGAIAYSLKPFIDGMEVTKAPVSANYAPLIIVGFTLLQGILNYISIYLNGWLGTKIMCDIREQLFIRLQSLNVSYFDAVTSGKVIQRYFRDPQNINQNILDNTKQLLTRLFSSLFLMGVLIYTSWQLSIIAITVLLLVLFPSTRIRKLIKNLAREDNAASGDFMSFYTETVAGIRVIYGYNMTASRLKKFRDYQRNIFHLVMKITKAKGWLTPSMHFISSVGIALIIWQGSLMKMSGQLTTGEFVSFIAAMLMLYNPIKNLGNSILTAQMSLFAADRIFTLLDYPASITDQPNAIKLKNIEQGIVFDNLSFRYTKPNYVLKNINLTFRKNETVAIVGGSGGGKSTIANLIPRLYEGKEEDGRILIDGVNIRDYTLESLRQNIAVVMQDTFLFSGTIKENLLVGNPKATDEQVWNAVEKAYLTDFVNSLPEGLDSMTGERGVLLSGGQRQRIAIARAILKDAPIVILDEATSALDNNSEAIVQKAMESLMKQRTVIVIAHRLSTIRSADRIVVLEKGEVVEEGTHTELMALNNYYAALYNTQFAVSSVLKESDVLENDRSTIILASVI
jgi:subfamily B ATP-binding cassette protein MsbA